MAWARKGARFASAGRVRSKKGRATAPPPAVVPIGPVPTLVPAAVLEPAIVAATQDEVDAIRRQSAARKADLPKGDVYERDAFDEAPGLDEREADVMPAPPASNRAGPARPKSGT